MRGSDGRSGELFSYVDLERRVRPNHPLRPIREIANATLARLSGDFGGLYSGMGRPSIAPEMLLRAMLLQAFYSIRSGRQLMEQLEFALLFRWFVGLGVDGEADQEATGGSFPRRTVRPAVAASGPTTRPNDNIEMRWSSCDSSTLLEGRVAGHTTMRMRAAIADGAPVGRRIQDTSSGG